MTPLSWAGGSQSLSSSSAYTDVSEDERDAAPKAGAAALVQPQWKWQEHTGAPRGAHDKEDTSLYY